jgi:hypothetical protein
VVLIGGYKALMNGRLPELAEEPAGLLVELEHHRMGL